MMFTALYCGMMFTVGNTATDHTLSAVWVLSQYRACSFLWHTASFCWSRRAFSSSAVSRISIRTQDWHFSSLYFSAKLQKVHLSNVALFYEIGITTNKVLYWFFVKLAREAPESISCSIWPKFLLIYCSCFLIACLLFLRDGRFCLAINK